MVATFVAMVAAVAVAVLARSWHSGAASNDDGDPILLCQASGRADSLADLAACVQRFVVPEGAVPAEAWHDPYKNYSPDEEQRRDLAKLARAMLRSGNVEECAALLLPDSLRRIYRPPVAFRDAALGEDFCVLLERVQRTGSDEAPEQDAGVAAARFQAGWAWLVVRLAPAMEAAAPAAAATTAIGVVESVRQTRQNQALPAERERQSDGERAEGSWRWQEFGGLWRRQQQQQQQQEREGKEGEVAPAAEAGNAAGRRAAGGWLSGATVRRLHLGAPHPTFEGPVDLQGVALFGALPAHARSVLVSGKHRRATRANSTCLPGAAYPASDPSHNAGDAFNVISYALLAEEAAEVGCCCGIGASAAATAAAPADPSPTSSSARSGDGTMGGGSGAGFGGGCCVAGGGGRAVFLQLHGKANTSCPNSTVFASGGFGRAASAFYGRNDTAVARLAAQLKAAAAAAAAAAVEPRSAAAQQAAESRGRGARYASVAAVPSSVPRRSTLHMPSEAAVAAAAAGTTCVALAAGAGAEAGSGGEAGAADGHTSEAGWGPWTVNLPPQDPGCVLVATRNVFGRVINGVPEAEACRRAADEGAGGGGPGGEAADCFGEFVHMEQGAAAQHPDVWGVWTDALQAMLQEEEEEEKLWGSRALQRVAGHCKH